jgi:hypothetical protein
LQYIKEPAMTTRQQRQQRKVLDRMVELAEVSTAIAAAEGADFGITPGIAPIEPAQLAALLETDPAAAWLTLAKLSPANLVVEAIDYTSWLNERSGRNVLWTAVLDVFERRIAKHLPDAVAA